MGRAESCMAVSFAPDCVFCGECLPVDATPIDTVDEDATEEKEKEEVVVVEEDSGAARRRI